MGIPDRPRRPRALALGLALAVASTAGVGRAAYQPAELWFTFRDLQIRESSGVAAGARTDDIVFTHNDSGDTPRFFAVRTSDGVTAATFGLGPTVREAIDFEDMARGPGRDGNPALFLGDIGDNVVSETVAVRPFVIVYEVPEPAVDPSQTGRTAAALPSATMLLSYEDGPHNAETLFVDPASGALGIVTKTVGGAAGVYLAEPAGAPFQVLRRVASIDLRALGSADALATGGDVAPDGSRIVVRTYTGAYEWAIPEAGLAAAFTQPPLAIALPETDQGEAIAYTRAGDGLVTTSEGQRAPVHILRPAP